MLSRKLFGFFLVGAMTALFFMAFSINNISYATALGRNAVITLLANRDTELSHATALGRNAVVTGAGVNVRGGPGTNFSKIGFVSKGDKLAVISEKNGWYQLRLTNGKTGWVIGSYLTISGSTVTPEKPAIPKSNVTTSKTATVAVSNVNVRSGPGTGFAKVATVNKPQQFKVIKESAGWYNIDLGNGRNGWILGALLIVKTIAVPTESSGSAEPVANIESTYLIVKESIVNVRAGAGTGFQVVGKVKAGDKYTVLQKSGDWYLVVLPNKAQGWIAGWLAEVRTVSNPSRGGTDTDKPVDPPPTEPADPQTDSGTQEESEAPVEKLRSVKLRSGENGEVLLLVESEGKIKYDVSRLKDPERLVFDLQNSDLNELGDPRPRGSLISDVRLAQYNDAPMTVRVVVDLTGPVSFKPSLSEDGLLLTVVISEPSIKGKIVVVDAGHGGYDPGAIGITGLQEKSYNIETALLLQDKLTALGATVILTRDDDSFISLNTRATVANQAYADIFVSIHANSSENPSVYGTSTYYYAPSSDQSLYAQLSQRKELAAQVQDKLAEALGTRDIGILQANFAVLRETQMPSILVETAFLSNSEDEALLKDSEFRDKAAQAIADGIAGYFTSGH